MSLSKPLPPFTYDLLRFFNRDQLDRFEIVCRPLKNLIEHYFHSKPCRVFDALGIRGGLYALFHKNVRWHPNRDDYSVQQFLDGQKCSIDKSNGHTLAEMRPYLGLPVRIKMAIIFVDGECTYNPEHVAEMESLSYLWRDHCLIISKYDESRIVAEDFLLILNSPTILQCRFLFLRNAHFSFKDYKVLNTANVFQIEYVGADDINLNHCLEFLEQPGVKPVLALGGLRREIIDNALDRLKQTFSSAVSPNAYKIVFVKVGELLTEFRERNKTSREVLELKKGLPVEYPEEYAEAFSSAVSPIAYKIVFVAIKPLAEFRETNKNSGEVLELKKGLPVEYLKECAEFFNPQNFDPYTLKRSNV